MSSADPADTLRTAAELAARGVRMVDAPVSGGVPRAVTGELSLMVGGDDADVASAQPVLRVLGDPARQFRTGALGTGHAMKALNNVVGRRDLLRHRRGAGRRRAGSALTRRR